MSTKARVDIILRALGSGQVRDAFLEIRHASNELNQSFLKFRNFAFGSGIFALLGHQIVDTMKNAEELNKQGLISDETMQSVMQARDSLAGVGSVLGKIGKEAAAYPAVVAQGLADMVSEVIYGREAMLQARKERIEAINAASTAEARAKQLAEDQAAALKLAAEEAKKIEAAQKAAAQAAEKHIASLVKLAGLQEELGRLGETPGARADRLFSTADEMRKTAAALLDQAKRDEVLLRAQELENDAAKLELQVQKEGLEIKKDQARYDREKLVAAERLRLVNEELSRIEATRGQEQAYSVANLETAQAIERRRLELLRERDSIVSEMQSTAEKAGPKRASRIQVSDYGFATVNDPENAFQSASDAIRGGLQDTVSTMGVQFDGIYQSVLNITSGISQGLGSAIEGLILRTTTWGDALRNVGSAILNAIVSSFAQMVAQYAVSQVAMFALSKVFGAKRAAATAVEASAAAAAWSPAAIAANMATFGAAGATGLAGFLAALSLGVAGATAITAAAGTAGIAAYAQGGDYRAGVPRLVGEFGPELDIPRESGVIMNHRETAVIAAALGAGSGAAGGQGARARDLVLVDSRREAERIRRGSQAEVDIVEIVRANKYRIFSGAPA